MENYFKAFEGFSKLLNLFVFLLSLIALYFQRSNTCKRSKHTKGICSQSSTGDRDCVSPRINSAFIEWDLVRTTDRNATHWCDDHYDTVGDITFCAMQNIP